MPINNASDGETLLIDKWLRGDESAMELLIQRYQQMIFNLAFYLGRCDRDTAYDLTVGAFTKTIQAFLKPAKANDGDFLRKLIQQVVEKCRPLPSVFVFDTSDFAAHSPEKKQLLSMAKEALFNISFEHRLLLLLRDQINLPYTLIASIAGYSLSAAKSDVIQARIQLGDKVEEILKRVRGEK